MFLGVERAVFSSRRVQRFWIGLFGALRSPEVVSVAANRANMWGFVFPYSTSARSSVLLDILLFSCSFVSDSLWPHALQHARPLWSSPFSKFTQVHVHCISDAIQPSHPLSSCSPAFSLSQQRGLVQRVSSSHQMTKILKLQLQHQSFQWVFRIHFP